MNPPQYYLVRFSGVAAHHFTGTCRGNIVLDVETYPPEQFYGYFNKELIEHAIHGSDIKTGTMQEFIEEINEKGLKAFVLSPSYGMTGWIVACGMDVLEMDAKGK